MWLFFLYFGTLLFFMRQVARSAHQRGLMDWHWGIIALIVWIVSSVAIHLADEHFNTAVYIGPFSVLGYLASILSCSVLWLSLTKFRKEESPEDLLHEFGKNQKEEGR
ncbi:MAG: hypothetical protein AB8F95_01335 [Bacteroidia bacterium]